MKVLGSPFCFQWKMAKVSSWWQLHHCKCRITPLDMVKLFLLMQPVVCSTWLWSFSSIFLCDDCMKMPGSEAVTFGPGHTHRHCLKEFDLLILTMLYTSRRRILMCFRGTFIVPNHLWGNHFLEVLGSEKSHVCDLCGYHHCPPCALSITPVSCISFLCAITWKGAI